MRIHFDMQALAPGTVCCVLPGCSGPFLFGDSESLVMDRALLDRIVNLTSELLAASGCFCVEAEWVAHERILRLFVDQDSEEGIDLDGCVKASRLLADAADLDAMVPGAYTLEVSSPGVERPLRKQRDFERFVGETVQVRLQGKVQERRNGKGRLVQVDRSGDDALITLETEQGVWSFPLAALQRASLVYDWAGAGARG